MGRTVGVSGRWLLYLWYASVLGVVPITVHVWVLPIDGWQSALGVVASAVVVLVTVGHAWHLRRDEGTGAITAGDRPYGLRYVPGSLQYESEAAGEDDDRD